MTRKALQLAATAYLTGDTNLSNAALALAKRWPRDRRAITLSKGGGGGGVIYDYTIIALSRVITPSTIFIDTRAA